MELDKEQIKKIIPYKEPFLFVSGVEKIDERKIFGFYQTSPNDYYFQGHFVDFKIMPGALVLEGLGQISTILLRKKIGPFHKNYHFLAYEVRGCQFLRPIFPGDRIDLVAEILAIYDIPNSKNKISRIKAKAFVENELKVEARFQIFIVDKKEFERKYVNFEPKRS